MPSVSAKIETSGPSRNSSMTTVPLAFACCSAASLLPVTTTPLPAARPSAFTTYGGPNSSRARSAAALSWHVLDLAVGTPAAPMTSLAKDLEPSIMAAPRPGPKQAIAADRTASATPLTRGASGPTTTRSVSSLAASAAISAGAAVLAACSSASSAMPGFPGAACRSVTAVSLARERASACSRPPDPMTSTRTAQSLPAARLHDFPQLDRLIAPRAYPDRPYRRADHVFQCLNVGPGVLWQIAELSS